MTHGTRRAVPLADPRRRQSAKKSGYPAGSGDGFEPSHSSRLGVLTVHSPARIGIADDRLALCRWRPGEPVKPFPNAILLASHGTGCTRLELTDRLGPEWVNTSPSDGQAISEGVQIDVRIRWKRDKRSLVERTHKGPMVRLLRRLDGLDARRLRLHRLPSDHGTDRAGVRGSAAQRNRNFLGHAGHAPGWSDGIRLAGRSDGAPSASDDLHSLVFHLQFPRGLLAKLHLPVRDPGAVGHRHGRGMAGWCGAGDGILAGAVARADVRRVAGVLGVGLRAVRPGLRLPVRTVGGVA